MEQAIPNHEPDKAASPDLGSVADELSRESDRLRKLAEELKACHETQAEMQANYPHFKQAVYGLLRQIFERELPPLPDRDLEIVAEEEDAQPLEVFIGELEGKAEGSK
jgi:septation ring formation regulator EzrA